MAALPIQVNLIPGYNRVPPVVKLNQYEYGFTRQFEVYYGDEAYTIPSGSNVRIDGTKQDRTGYSYSATFSGNVITVTIQDQMTVLAGLHVAELVIIPADMRRISTINLTMDIEKGALDQNTPISETEIPAIVEAAKYSSASAANSARAAATSAANAAASEDSVALNATRASEAASAAEDSRDHAATSAANAATSETNAATSASNAAASETNAATSAYQAQTYAGLVVPDFYLDPIDMILYEEQTSDKLIFSYSTTTGELSYEFV